MELLYLIAGAAIFYTGFLVGKKDKTTDRKKYMELYGRTSGLMQPVRRRGNG